MNEYDVRDATASRRLQQPEPTCTTIMPAKVLVCFIGIRNPGLAALADLHEPVLVPIIKSMNVMADPNK